MVVPGRKVKKVFQEEEIHSFYADRPNMMRTNNHLMDLVSW